MVSFQRFKNANMAIAPSISVISVSLQCRCSSIICASVTTLGWAAAAGAKSSANRCLMLYDRLVAYIHTSASFASLMPKFFAPQQRMRLAVRAT